MIAVVFGLVSVIVIVEAPFISIVPGLKPLTAVGGANTVSVAVAAVPGNVFAVVTTPVLFRYDPAAVAVTGTTMEQLPEIGIFPLDRLIELPPLVMVTVPPQVFDDGVSAVFCMLVGYVSVKAAPLINVVLGLVSVMVMLVAPFTGIVIAPKLFVTVGAASAA